MWICPNEEGSKIKESRIEEVRRMKKTKMLILTPKSSFLLIKCRNCGTERVVFSHSTTRIFCEVCSTLLVEPTGGKAIIHGEIIRRLD